MEINNEHISTEAFQTFSSYIYILKVKAKNKICWIKYYIKKNIFFFLTNLSTVLHKNRALVNKALYKKFTFTAKTN